MHWSHFRCFCPSAYTYHRLNGSFSSASRPRRLRWLAILWARSSVGVGNCSSQMSHTVGYAPPCFSCWCSANVTSSSNVSWHTEHTIVSMGSEGCDGSSCLAVERRLERHAFFSVFNLVVGCSAVLDSRFGDDDENATASMVAIVVDTLDGLGSSELDSGLPTK